MRQLAPMSLWPSHVKSCERDIECPYHHTSHIYILSTLDFNSHVAAHPYGEITPADGAPSLARCAHPHAQNTRVMHPNDTFVERCDCASRCRFGMPHAALSGVNGYYSVPPATSQPRGLPRGLNDSTVSGRALSCARYSQHAWSMQRTN